MMPYTLKLANMGWRGALQSDPGFLEGLNVHGGKVTYQAVTDAVGTDYTPVAQVLQTRLYPVHSDRNWDASGRRLSLTCLMGVPR